MIHDLDVAHCQVAISNVLGLHLRAAHQFVRLAGQYQSEVGVRCKGITANGKSILDLLSLAAECGTMLALEARGCDAEDVVAALANLISAQSHESEDKGGEASSLGLKTIVRFRNMEPTQPGFGSGTVKGDAWSEHLGARDMTIFLEFLGGFIDGQTLSSDSEDSNEAKAAQTYYALTRHGAVGSTFRTISDLGMQSLMTEDLQEFRGRGFDMNHKYQVIDRTEKDGNVNVRLKYLGQED